MKRERIASLGWQSARIWAIGAVMSMGAPAAFGQYAPISSPFDGTTPAGNQPEAPDGAFHLSGLDKINLSSDLMTFFLPLLDIPGRGDAKATAVLRIASSWKVQTLNTPSNCNQTSCTWTTSYVLLFDPWYETLTSGTPIQPTLVGGYMIQRGAGDYCQTSGNNGANSYFVNTLTRLTEVQSDGSETEFRDVVGTQGYPALGGLPAGPYSLQNSSGYPRGPLWQAFDGSDALFTANAAVGDPTTCTPPAGGIGGTLVDRNGTIHTYSSNVGFAGYEVKVEDRNGNVLCLSADCATSQGGTSGDSQVITDDLGRTTTITYGASSSTITYPGTGGALRTITVDYNSLGNLLRSGYSLQTVANAFPVFCPPDGSQSNCTSTIDPNNLPSEVLLPDGTSYNFLYDNYGNLAEVDLPTGGAYQYDYYTGSQLSVFQTGSPPTASFSIYMLVKEKRVYSGAPSTSTLQQVICFGETSNRITYATQTGCPSPTLGSESVTALGSVLAPPVTGEYAGGLFYNGWMTGVETAHSYYDLNGNLLKTETKTFQGRACGSGADCALFTGTNQQGTSAGTYNSGCSNPNSASQRAACPAHDTQLASETTAYNGATSQNIYQYDTYNNRTSVAEYGFGNGVPGALIRTTTTCFDADTSWCPTTQGTSYSAYLAANILDLPLVETVYSGNPTSNMIAAQTSYMYDAGTITDCAGIYSHDTGYGTSYQTRGNATSISRLLNDSINNISNVLLTTTQTFDIAGNMLTTVDPRGVQEQTSYTDPANTKYFALPMSKSYYTGQ